MQAYKDPEPSSDVTAVRQGITQDGVPTHHRTQTAPKHGNLCSSWNSFYENQILGVAFFSRFCQLVGFVQHLVKRAHKHATVTTCSDSLLDMYSDSLPVLWLQTDISAMSKWEQTSDHRGDAISPSCIALPEHMGTRTHTWFRHKNKHVLTFPHIQPLTNWSNIRGKKTSHNVWYVKRKCSYEEQNPWSLIVAVQRKARMFSRDVHFNNWGQRDTRPDALPTIQYIKGTYEAATNAMQCDSVRFDPTQCNSTRYDLMLKNIKLHNSIWYRYRNAEGESI